MSNTGSPLTTTRAPSHEGFLSHARYRWAKHSLLLCVIAIAAYRIDDPVAGRSGGTLLGYALGGVATVLILWLSWLGIRRRRYASGFGSVRGWTSAHVWLGLSLTVLSTLHAAFQFGWNIHTLAWAICMLVIASGLYGVLAYSHYPTRITANRSGGTRDGWLDEIVDSEDRALLLAASVGPDAHNRVLQAIADTRYSSGLFARLFGRAVGSLRREDGMTTLDAIAGPLATGLRTGEDAQRVAQLIDLLARREGLLGQLNRDLRHQARMRVWLLLHVPLTTALLAALTAHIVSVFLYW